MRFAYLAFALLLVGACGSDSEPPPDVDAATTGTLSIAWTISDGTGLIDCQDVGAESMRIDAVEVNSAFGEVVAFACTRESATSRPLAAGTYRLTVDLRTGDSRSLLPAPIVLDDIEIEVGLDTDLGAQAFTVAPTGSLVFTAAAAGAAAGNCADEGSGGAGIVGFRFNLFNGAGDCVETTFTIAGGTFASDCNNAVPFPCIDADQQVSVSPTSSGVRSLDITADIAGDLPCRKSVTNYAQPGNDLEVDLGAVELEIDTAEPGCE